MNPFEIGINELVAQRPRREEKRPSLVQDVDLYVVELGKPRPGTSHVLGKRVMDNIR